MARRADGAPAFEEWDLDADPASVRRRLDALAGVPEPIELSLRCSPALWLPDDRVQIIEVEPSLKLWRVVKAPVKLLTLEVMFDLDESAAGVLLQISFRCDLWCDTRMDGELGAAHNMANARLLARAVEEVALATKAEITRRPT